MKPLLVRDNRLPAIFGIPGWITLVAMFTIHALWVLPTIGVEARYCLDLHGFVIFILTVFMLATYASASQDDREYPSTIPLLGFIFEGATVGYFVFTHQVGQPATWSMASPMIHTMFVIGGIILYLSAGLIIAQVLNRLFPPATELKAEEMA